MPVYEYSALNERGKTTSGIIDAESAVAARQRLRTTKLFPVSVNEVHDAHSLKKPRRWAMPALFSRISPAELAVITRQISTLVAAGFPLVSAFDALLPHIARPRLKKTMAKVKDTIVEGNSFAHALELFPGTFSPVYINMVRSGESAGNLDIVLDRLAHIMERQQAVKTRIRAALIYPLLMAMIGVLVLFLLLTFIVPNITSIFTDMNRALPAPTRFLIAVSEMFRRWWWLIALALLGGVIGVSAAKRSARGRHMIDKLRLRLPIMAPLTRKLAVARFTRTLGSLLENGVSMLTALGIAKNVTGNSLIADAIDSVAVEVGKGGGLSEHLAHYDYFSGLPVQMVTVGEQGGQLEEMLEKVSTIYEQEAESRIVGLASLLEPLMILALGVIIGFIVLSICLPIFEMNQLIG